MGMITSAGVNQVVDAADKVSASAVEAIDATQNAVFAQLEQVVSIGDQTADAAMAELKEARDRYVGLLRQYANILVGLSPV